MSWVRSSRTTISSIGKRTRLDDAFSPEDARVARAFLGEACRSARGLPRSKAIALAEDLGRGDDLMIHRVLKVLEHDGYLRYQAATDGDGAFVFWSGLLRDWWRRQFRW